MPSCAGIDPVRASTAGRTSGQRADSAERCPGSTASPAVQLARPYAAAANVPVKASIGLTLSSDGAGADPGELLRGADVAMYDAKIDGRGRWSRYAEHMHTELLARVELEG